MQISLQHNAFVRYELGRDVNALTPECIFILQVLHVRKEST